MISFVILCYPLIAIVTIYFSLRRENIMKIYRHTRLYWKLEIIYYKWLTILNNLNGKINGFGGTSLL